MESWITNQHLPVTPSFTVHQSMNVEMDQLVHLLSHMQVSKCTKPIYVYIKYACYVSYTFYLTILSLLQLVSIAPMSSLGPSWQNTYPVYESDSLGLLCAYKGGIGAVDISLSGGDGLVVGTQLPVSEATDGSCLPNTSMVVEWATTNLTLRRQMNDEEITCTAKTASQTGTHMSTELDVQCKFNIITIRNMLMLSKVI